MLPGPHSIWYPFVFSVRMTPPGRDVRSSTTASIPNLLSVHAHERPLIPAPMMMTSGICSLYRAFNDLGQRADERGIAVQSRHAPEILNAGFCGDLFEKNIQFVERLDVFGYEADR